MSKKIIFGLVLSTIISAPAFAATAPVAAPTAAKPAAAPSSAPVPGSPLAAKAGAPAANTNPFQNWEKLTREQKGELLEKTHADGVRRSEDRWKAMSMDEKIAQFEANRKKAMEARASQPRPAGAPAAPANAATATRAPAPAAAPAAVPAPVKK